MLSANAEFKSQYNKTLRWSVAIALLITVVAFIVSPEIRFTPYKLRTEELEVVDIEDQPEDIELPPPPAEAPPPPKVIEAALRLKPMPTSVAGLAPRAADSRRGASIRDYRAQAEAGDGA
mgnify:CR=1 FL=1